MMCYTFKGKNVNHNFEVAYCALHSQAEREKDLHACTDLG